MRAIRNRVYGNSVTGVQIPPHPPILIIRLLGRFFMRMSRFELRRGLVFNGRDFLLGI